MKRSAIYSDDCARVCLRKISRQQLLLNLTEIYPLASLLWKRCYFLVKKIKFLFYILLQLAGNCPVEIRILNDLTVKFLRRLALISAEWGRYCTVLLAVMNVCDRWILIIFLHNSLLDIAYRCTQFSNMNEYRFFRIWSDCLATIILRFWLKA